MFKRHKYEIIAYIAGSLNIIAFFNLVIHNYTIRDTNSLSWTWLLTGLVTQVLWLIFGVANQILPNIIISPILMIGLFALLFLKINLEFGYNFSDWV